MDRGSSDRVPAQTAVARWPHRAGATAGGVRPRWELFLQGCDACRPGTYSTIYAQHATFREAPDWVPDLASIGAAGLLLDGKDPRYEALGDSSYRQDGDVYILRLKEVVPNGSSAP